MVGVLETLTVRRASGFLASSLTLIAYSPICQLSLRRNFAPESRGSKLNIHSFRSSGSVRLRSKFGRRGGQIVCEAQETAVQGRAVQCADQGVVDELKAISDMKRSFLKKQIDSSLPHVTILLSEIKEQQSLMKMYEITMNKMAREIKSKVRKGSRFSEVYMESVTDEAFSGGGELRVAFTVVLGFKIGETVVQSQVYVPPTQR
ncbi:hypothetical protein L2E82_26928 [Cichorium intybus]|uniref:Uncharacterized protein n=1 Tax=Cichorium intybus TaxID=13427 RepID=A0ACB9CRJ9_CICIN|nr:hypothetical protein L2E82_26928 [Cichorium intybus]